ncbi:FAD-dependent oxidoreductase [Microvirga sp. Mcv34]|uniref:FAD-dependent oxidoreductase n=1 Tax=Microvirga sp. Mcv34 TaxID=2926016 RepID=UPI0021C6166E|nr:FAD-dependent oxidoreductase [Microvirga sp. Mcv34]
MSTEEVLPSSCDLLVVGSGAAGLAAAISAAHAGLKPVIVEKSEYFGGSSAVSGGAIWIPDNPIMRAAGMEDDRKAARRYIELETGNRFNAELVDAFLDNGPAAIDFFNKKTALKMTHRPYAPDYHPDKEGAALGGRVLDAMEYDGRALGKNLNRLRPPIKEFTILGGMQLGRADLFHFVRMTREWPSFVHATKQVARYFKDRISVGRNTRLSLGAAVVGRLAETVFALKIPLLTEHELISLQQDGLGRVTGAVLRTRLGDRTIVTTKGVVLASGGFPHDVKRRAETFEHVRRGLSHYSMAPSPNTGGAISAAEAIGAAFVSTNSDAASWAPVSLIPQPDGSKRPFPHLFMDRAKPGIIAVSHDGRRFTNEAASYHDFVQGLVEKLLDEGENSAFLVCDHDALRRYGLGAVPCFPGRIGPYLKSGYLKRGLSVEELARVCGIDAGVLQKTIDRYNGLAAQGVDPDFGKGSTPYQTALGDPNHRPNQCLKPLEGVLYAVEIFPGDIGTTMGLDVNANAQVRDTQGQVIEGLYACGNDINSIMSGSYPGAGITLGPALTFGYVIGRHAAS